MDAAAALRGRQSARRSLRNLRPAASPALDLGCRPATPRSNSPRGRASGPGPARSPARWHPRPPACRARTSIESVSEGSKMMTASYPMPSFRVAACVIFLASTLCASVVSADDGRVMRVGRVVSSTAVEPASNLFPEFYWRLQLPGFFFSVSIDVDEPVAGWIRLYRLPSGSLP